MQKGWDRMQFFDYFVHLSSPFSLFSRTYPLTGFPPSLFGGVQVRVILSSVVALHLGTPGAPGLSRKNKKGQSSSA